MNPPSLAQACLTAAALYGIARPVSSRKALRLTSKAATQDPALSRKFPARMEAIRVPSGDVRINGVVMVPSGAGPHPAFVLLHGLPGYEKNLDLAQAVRRAGWSVVTFNYRGSWGSPGDFGFGHSLEDARAVLAFIRHSENARRLGIDADRIAVGGHGMGGWVAAQTAASEPDLLATVTICARDMGHIGIAARSDLAAVASVMDDNRETLAGVTGERMAQELAALGPAWSFATLAARLKDKRLLVLYSNDFAKPDSKTLIARVKAEGGKSIRSVYIPTDHNWSDRRIALSALVINGLQSLPAAR